MRKRKATSITRLHAPGPGAALAVGFAAALVGMVTAAAFAQPPERPDTGHVMIGGEIFSTYCVSCHGNDAKGDGPIAESLAVAPSDLTRLAGEDGQFPFEEVMKAIDGRKEVGGHGRSDMPEWGSILEKAGTGSDQDQVQAKITSLTHFLWSIQVGDDR